MRKTNKKECFLIITLLSKSFTIENTIGYIEMLCYLLQYYREKEKITVVSEIKFCSRHGSAAHWV